MKFNEIVFILDDLKESDLENLVNSILKNKISSYFFLNDTQLIHNSKDKFDDDNINFFENNEQTEIHQVLYDDLKIQPDQTVLVSDNPEMVKHFRKSGLACCVGIGRDKTNFYKHYADIVLNEFIAINFKELSNWFEQHYSDETWSLSYKHFDEDQEKLRETLTTVGNGFVGHRNAVSFMKTDEDTHYPGTYIAGLFNKVPTKIADRNIYNNDFVNIPNAFLVEFKFDDDYDLWHLSKLNVKDYNHRLNMKTGEAQREMVLEHSDGRQIRYVCKQFASMENKHLLGHKVVISPLNFSGNLKLISSIDGDIINYGVPRYRKLNGHHFDVIKTDAENNRINLVAQTTTSKVKVDLSVYHRNYSDCFPTQVLTDKTAQLHYNKKLEQNETFTLERTVFIETSRNPYNEEKCFLDYELTLKNSAKAWSHLWNEIDIKIEGDRYAQELIRMQLYHLMCSASPHNTELDAGITARGLHGEAYRGHIFWDELFILPFYFKHLPDVAKSIIMYRYRRLDAARKHAKDNNKEGALIPWQIADTGEEETQEIHYNPMSKQWDPDLSRKQRHVSISVAFNIINYHRYTQDDEFLAHEGGEMLLEIIRYWASKVIYNDKDKRYHIYRVMGPDEFHEKYPDNPTTDGGIDDNAYTNIMVSWLLHKAVDFLPKISDNVKSKIDFNPSVEEKKWIDIKDKLYVNIEDNIIEQFDGYFGLKEIDWEKYEKKYGDIGRMDRILKSENNSPDHYKVAKQADTLMLFYLLDTDEIEELIEGLGYKIDDPKQFLIQNFDYYIKRTSHGSTLSYVVHAYLLDEIPNRDDQLWKWFNYALNSDFDDIQGGTTEEGIHCGVMAGNINLIYNCFAGIKMGDKIKLNPNLPKHWKGLDLKIKFQNKNYQFIIARDKIKIKTNQPHNKTLLYKAKEHSFEKNDEIIIDI